MKPYMENAVIETAHQAVKALLEGYYILIENGTKEERITALVRYKEAQDAYLTLVRARYNI